MTDRKAFDEWWQSSDLRGREPLHAAWMAWQAATERAAKKCEGLKVGLPSYFEIDERIQECADAIRSGS